MNTNIDNTMTANTGDNTDCRNGSYFMSKMHYHTFVLLEKLLFRSDSLNIFLSFFRK